MISDKRGLEHPEEKIRQVIARLSHGDPLRGELLLSKAGDPAQRAALERAVEAKRALLAMAAVEEPPVEMAMPAQGISLVMDAGAALELHGPGVVVLAGRK